MPRNYGDQFVDSLREYLTQNNLSSLGKISGGLMAELSQRFHEKWIAVQKPKRTNRVKLATEEEWILSLETDPALKGTDIRRELGKAIFWCNQQRPPRKCTRAMFTNWLLKAQATAGVYDGASSKPRKEAPPKPVYTPEKPVPGWPLILRSMDSEWDLDSLCAGDWNELPLEIRNKIIQVA